LYDERGAAEISDFYNFTSSYGDLHIDITRSEGETEEDAEDRAIDALTRKVRKICSKERCGTNMDNLVSSEAL